MKIPPFRPYYTTGTLRMEQRYLVHKNLDRVIESVVNDRALWDTCEIYDRDGKVIWATEEMCFKCKSWRAEPGPDHGYTGDFYCIKDNYPEHRCPEFEFDENAL